MSVHRDVTDDSTRFFPCAGGLAGFAQRGSGVVVKLVKSFCMPWKTLPKLLTISAAKDYPEMLLAANGEDYESPLAVVGDLIWCVA